MIQTLDKAVNKETGKKLEHFSYVILQLGTPRWLPRAAHFETSRTSHLQQQQMEEKLFSQECLLGAHTKWKLRLPKQTKVASLSPFLSHVQKTTVPFAKRLTN